MKGRIEKFRTAKIAFDLSFFGANHIFGAADLFAMLTMGAYFFDLLGKNHPFCSFLFAI